MDEPGKCQDPCVHAQLLERAETKLKFAREALEYIATLPEPWEQMRLTWREAAQRALTILGDGREDEHGCQDRNVD